MLVAHLQPQTGGGVLGLVFRQRPQASTSRGRRRLHSCCSRTGFRWSASVGKKKQATIQKRLPYGLKSISTSLSHTLASGVTNWKVVMLHKSVDEIKIHELPIFSLVFYIYSFTMRILFLVTVIVVRKKKRSGREHGAYSLASQTLHGIATAAAARLLPQLPMLVPMRLPDGPRPKQLTRYRKNKLGKYNASVMLFLKACCSPSLHSFKACCFPLLFRFFVFLLSRTSI